LELVECLFEEAGHACVGLHSQSKCPASFPFKLLES
jgi:hypothetical protein